MPTVYLNYKNNSKIKIAPKNKSEYYLKLIIKQTLECLNSNCISYITENRPNKNFKIDANITLSPILNQKLIPCRQSGIQVFFMPGNPKSKRIAEVMAENLKNIYYNPQNVTIHSKEKNQTDMQMNNKTHVYLCLGYEKSSADMAWLKESTEEVSQNIIMSLTEYFGLPFAPCLKPFIGITRSDSNIFSKPNKKSKIIGFISKNRRVQINGQWEDWYIIGKNHDLGYIPSKFIDVV